MVDALCPMARPCRPGSDIAVQVRSSGKEPGRNPVVNDPKISNMGI